MIEILEIIVDIYIDEIIFYLGCTTGWVPYRGQCYKAFYDEVDRVTAETLCSNENSAILASSRDIEENNFLTSLV